MNASYEKNVNFNSNNDIFNQYFQNAKQNKNRWKKYADRLFAILATLVLFVTRVQERGLFRIGGIAFCLIGIIGLVGAMESGSTPLWFGILIGILLLAVEYFCLRPRKK